MKSASLTKLGVILTVILTYGLPLETSEKPVLDRVLH
jgi:hypothetical protein